MIDEEEFLFVVDENNNPLEAKSRGEVHKNGLWHRISHIWIVNSKGQILCQKRSKAKDIYPGRWETFFGGHILAGEQDLDSAVKEVSEELGANVNTGDLLFFKVIKISRDLGKMMHNQFCSIYLLKWDGDEERISFEKEEVDEVKWVDARDIERVLSKTENNTWVDPGYQEDFFEWLRKRKIVS